MQVVDSKSKKVFRFIVEVKQTNLILTVGL
jgi:hypothetical protein